MIEFASAVIGSILAGLATEALIRLYDGLRRGGEPPETHGKHFRRP